MADRDSGASMRRRQRRLRSWWRHERRSIAAVLATVSHHSLYKVGTANAALLGQKIGTSIGVGPAEFLRSFRTMAGRGQRPASMLEPLVTGEGLAAAASGTSSSRLSMLLCCRWWNSCRTSSSSFARLLLPSRLSKCPRFCSRTKTRSAERCANPQLAELLVEVPTILHFLKQTVDNPVPGARVRRRGDLQGFHTGQGSAAPLGAEQNVDI